MDPVFSEKFTAQTAESVAANDRKWKEAMFGQIKKNAEAVSEMINQ